MPQPRCHQTTASSGRLSELMRVCAPSTSPLDFLFPFLRTAAAQRFSLHLIQSCGSSSHGVFILVTKRCTLWSKEPRQSLPPFWLFTFPANVRSHGKLGFRDKELLLWFAWDWPSEETRERRRGRREGRRWREREIQKCRLHPVLVSTSLPPCQETS